MSKALDRIKNIKKKIVFIQEIVEEEGGVVNALKDEKRSRAAILMHLTSMSEQFDKLAKEGEYMLLEKFDKRDIKGSYDVRNFIAHDYEGVNLMIIENTIRYRLPEIEKIVDDIIHNQINNEDIS